MTCVSLTQFNRYTKLSAKSHLAESTHAAATLWQWSSPQETSPLQPVCHADRIFKKGGLGWQWCIAYLPLGAPVVCGVWCSQWVFYCSTFWICTISETARVDIKTNSSISATASLWCICSSTFPQNVTFSWRYRGNLKSSNFFLFFFLLMEKRK